MRKKVLDTTEKLRDLQLTELEIAVEVDRICHKHGIRYSLDGGTLLGAVRHHGFIPWDDDMDIIFTRTEYEKFFLACQKDLDQDRFFLQDYRTDPYYRWGHAKMRRKETEFIRFGQEHMRYRTGVAIDIFVLDHVPDAIFARQIHFAVNYAIRKILYSELGKMSENNIFVRMWYTLLNLVPRNACFGMRNAISRIMNKHQTELAAHLLYPYPKSCRYGIPTKIFAEYEEMSFEGMRFSVVKEYDKYLTLLYGEYMKLPPKEKRETHNPASEIKLLPVTLEHIQKGYRA